MKFILLALCALAATAQVTITPAAANAVTDRSARVNVTLSAAANVYAQFGPTTAYGSRSSGGNPGTTNAVVVMTGLTPGSVNNYRICQTGYTPPTGCTSNQTVTTLAEQTFTPTAPTDVNTTYPSSFTATYNVASDCSDLMTQVATAAAQDGNNNYLVSIPAGTTCAGSYTFSAKTGTNPTGSGVIVIASAGTLPPPGSRITEAFYTNGQMVRFLHTSIDSGFATEGGPNYSNCLVMSHQYRSDLDDWYGCFSAGTWTLLSGIAGNTRTASTPLSTDCDNVSEVGRYHIRTGQGRDGLYYCHSILRWVPLRGSATGASPAPSGYTIQFPSGSKGYRFVGIQFEFAIANYSQDNTFIVIDPGASNIIIDRCLIKPQRTAGGRPINLDGANVALIDSYLDVIPWGIQFAQSSTVRVSTGPGPLKVHNNYLAGCFIVMFVNDTDPQDITVTRNNMKLQPECDQTDPAWNGRLYYDTRAIMEFKYGKKILIDGNTFENFYTLLTTGSQILLTTRAGSSVGGDNNDYQIRDVKISNNIFKAGKGGGVEVWGQDNQWYRNTKMTARFEFSNNLGYSLVGGVFRSPMVYIQDGIEKATIRNNTWYNNSGSAPAIMTFSSPFGGLDFRNNLVWINQGGITGSGDGDGGGIRWINDIWSSYCDGSTTTGGASVKLDKCAVVGTTPNYTFSNNAIVGGLAGYTSTYQSQYPTGNFWPGDTTTGITALGFTDTANADYSLKYSSTYAKYGLGADINSIKAAQGIIYNARALQEQPLRILHMIPLLLVLLNMVPHL
jgi:hypothetical protein